MAIPEEIVTSSANHLPDDAAERANEQTMPRAAAVGIGVFLCLFFGVWTQQKSESWPVEDEPGQHVAWQPTH